MTLELSVFFHWVVNSVHRVFKGYYLLLLIFKKIIIYEYSTCSFRNFNQHFFFLGLTEKVKHSAIENYYDFFRKVYKSLHLPFESPGYISATNPKINVTLTAGIESQFYLLLLAPNKVFNINRLQKYQQTVIHS